jgi:hypothetical protein
MLQMIPKKNIKSLAIPDKTLNDGLRGSLEVIFQDPGMLSDEEEMDLSFEHRMKGVTSRKAGSPKDVIMVNPNYLRDLKYFVTSDAASILQSKSAVKAQAFQSALPNLLANPDIFDRKETGREYIRQLNLSPRLLNTEEAPAAPPQGAGQPPAGPEQAQAPEQAQMSDVSKATTGIGLPALSGTQ